jgi:hypothetical protein
MGQNIDWKKRRLGEKVEDKKLRLGQNIKKVKNVDWRKH